MERTTAERTVEELAEGLTAAVTARDADAVERLYGPGVVVWNSSRPDASTEENQASFRANAAIIRSIRYEHVRRQCFTGAFVQQHEVHVVGPDGEERRIPACIVATVAGGAIVRIDEYVG